MSILWRGRAQAWGKGVLGDKAMQSSIPGVAFPYPPHPRLLCPAFLCPQAQAPLLLLPRLACRCWLLEGTSVLPDVGIRTGCPRVLVVWQLAPLRERGRRES